MSRTKRQELEQAATDFLRRLAPAVEESLVEGTLDYTLPGLSGDVTYGELVDLMARCSVYEFPKADNTADAVVFGIDLEEGVLKVLLIERGREGEPFCGYWALPGGFIDLGEGLDRTALRELREETGVALSYMEQLYTFSAPDRDPRGRVIATAYLGLVRPQAVTIKAADDAANARWFPVTQLPV